MKMHLMLMSLVSIVSSLPQAFAASAVQSFDTGDKITCSDDVSGHTYVLKVLDLSDREAYVRVKGRGFGRFFPTEKVILGAVDDGVTFTTLSESDDAIETLTVYDEVKANGVGGGHYQDGGDSRALDCKLGG